jgi:hypothetical protein
MKCPKCKRRTQSINVFDKIRWTVVTICKSCCGVFKDDKGYSNKNDKRIIWNYLCQLNEVKQ